MIEKYLEILRAYQCAIGKQVAGAKARKFLLKNAEAEAVANGQIGVGVIVEGITAKDMALYHEGYLHGLEVAGKLAEIYLKGGDKNE
mgnify:CR=1 FL=1